MATPYQELCKALDDRLYMAELWTEDNQPDKAQICANQIGAIITCLQSGHFGTYRHMDSIRARYYSRLLELGLEPFPDAFDNLFYYKS